MSSPFRYRFHNTMHAIHQSSFGAEDNGMKWIDFVDQSDVRSN